MFVSGECSNAVNSACAMRCNPGHELIGSTIRLCNETGLWTGYETRCLGRYEINIISPSDFVMRLDYG